MTPTLEYHRSPDPKGTRTKILLVSALAFLMPVLARAASEILPGIPASADSASSLRSAWQFWLHLAVSTSCCAFAMTLLWIVHWRTRRVAVGWPSRICLWSVLILNTLLVLFHIVFAVMILS